jgi:hypothetical protein
LSFIETNFYMSMGTKNDLTYPFTDMRMWRQIFSIVINNDDASDYGTIILKRESIFDLHIREGEWTIEERENRETINEEYMLVNRVLSNNFDATQKNIIQYAQLLFTMYITITFVRIWVSKQLSCTDFNCCRCRCLHNFLFTYP